MAGDMTEVDALWQEQSRRLTAADAAYGAVREAILRGHLPPGYRLNEVGLAQRFSISRTPIREALLRLESERLIERNGRGGLVVGEITPEDILEIYVVREVLNGLVARLAAEHAKSVDIAEARWLFEALREAAAERDYTRMASVNVEFHEALCRATRNELLLTLMKQVHDRVKRIPGTTFSVPERAEQALVEHEQVLRAIEAHDGDAAERLARAHMARAMQLRIQMLRHDRFPVASGEQVAALRPEEMAGLRPQLERQQS